MSMSGRYVVALKAGDPTDSVRAWAAEHATAAGAPVLTVHVAADGVPHGAGPASGPSLRNEVAVTLDGPVTQALASFVNQDDVLVLGTDKTGFLYSRVLGVRGVQIASVVRCSVAVIPRIDLRFRSGVVAGIDREETAALVARAAGTEAAARRQPLQLIHSSPAGRMAATESADDPLLSLARSAVSQQWPDLVIRSRVTARPPTEALLDASRNAALLVLGPGAAPVDTPFASVIHDVLVNINAPVLIVRPGRDLEG